MNPSQVRALLEQGSGSDIAFVPERSARMAVAETLGALANGHGGTLLLGVTQAGAIRGVRNARAQADKALMAALLTDPPLVLPLPEPVEMNGRTIVVVQVPNGLPHVYQLGGRYLVREDGHNRPLTAAQVHQLMARRGVTHFETQAPPVATLGDLDWDRVRQYANRMQPFQDLDAQQVLQRRGCLSESAGARQPTHAGLLLFGRETSPWRANAEITAVRYAQPQMTDEFIREDITGPLSDQIRKAEAFLQANTTESVVLEGLTREAQPTYPVDVLREVIVNAVAHRDYAIQGESIRLLVFSDRVQVYSPGRLPGHVTVENIVEERFSRNPVIVQILSDLGFIERLGYGIDRMLRLLEQAGHPPPAFEETAAGFQVTLYARTAAPEIQTTRWAGLELNPRQEQALHYLVEQGRITNREYQTLCPSVSAETIRRDLGDLVHKDILLRIGRKRATYYILKDARLAGT